jgi:hypothetical protein
MQPDAAFAVYFFNRQRRSPHAFGALYGGQGGCNPDCHIICCIRPDTRMHQAQNDSKKKNSDGGSSHWRSLVWEKGFNPGKCEICNAWDCGCLFD